MDVPETVTTALSDRPVSGAVCLEAGAGVGNTTAGLLAAGASRVYAVTNDADHAGTVRERVGRDAPDRTAVLEADLRALPLPDESVDVVTAHGLCNVLPPSSLAPVLDELTRVAAPGCHLVVDDYEPLDGAAVRDLFALENAAAELAENRPALTFYPSALLRALVTGYGWQFDRERTLLDPVPWTANHVEAHADVARSHAETLPREVAEALTARTDSVAADVGEEAAGEMYSLAFRHPD